VFYDTGSSGLSRIKVLQKSCDVDCPLMTYCSLHAAVFYRFKLYMHLIWWNFFTFKRISFN